MSNPRNERRRSALYVPGSNARAIEKARDIAADVLILDLEDAVAPAAKEAARRQVAMAVQSRAFGPREVLVRVNGLDSPWGRDDFRAVTAARPDGVVVPKVERPDDIHAAADALNGDGATQAPRVWAMIETPRAIVEVGSIADCAAQPECRLEGFVLGLNDLAKATGVRLSQGRMVWLPWMMNCIASARANAIAILDGVYNGLAADDGFDAECRQAVEIGMDGKTLIHPRQVDRCNLLFAPRPAEVEWARAVVDAFDAVDETIGVVTVQGQMVERLHLDSARRILGLNS